MAAPVKEYLFVLDAPVLDMWVYVKAESAEQATQAVRASLEAVEPIAAGDETRELDVKLPNGLTGYLYFRPKLVDEGLIESIATW